MTPPAGLSGLARRGATIGVLAARIVLGALLVHEGYVKYHAGFGRSDILLVVQSAANNPRVPEVFRWFTAEVMGRFPDLFGIVVPFTETALGVALILGIVPRLAALATVTLLSSYWLSDQLVIQYPVIMLLAAIVLVSGEAASRVAVPLPLKNRVRGRASSPSA